MIDSERYTKKHRLLQRYIAITFLEISLQATARGFESLPLRQNLSEMSNFREIFLLFIEFQKEGCAKCCPIVALFPLTTSKPF